MSYFLNGIFISMLFVLQLDAKDLGVYGSTACIIEQNLISFIEEKIQSFSEENRELFIESMQKSFVSLLKKPMEIDGIKKTIRYSVKYVDPSVSVHRDIVNHKGQIVVKKGTQYNPLSQVCLTQSLLFFDATDKNQVSWAASQPFSTWILIKGNPFELEEKLNRPIYFDQNGTLLKKYGIENVPARISQDGLQLKIESIPVEVNS
jgi:conjugal transfer pilus assembly protein TraW